MPRTVGQAIHPQCLRGGYHQESGCCWQRPATSRRRPSTLANGTYLALEERGNKIMGQPAELVWLDEPSPQGSQQNMQRLVQENKVVAILARLPQLQRPSRAGDRGTVENPFVCNNAAATDISGKNCNHYTFRLNTPVAVQAAMFAPYIMGYGQEVVLPDRELRIRTGHREVVQGDPGEGRRYGRG